MVCMALKALLCSGDDELPQHWSVLRAIRTLNSPQNYTHLFGGLLPIHRMRQRRAQGLMWGTRGLSPPAGVMVGYGCVGLCWPLEANVRSTYRRNSKNCLRKFFLNSYLYPIHSWHLTHQLNKEELDLCTCNISWFLCPIFYGIRICIHWFAYKKSVFLYDSRFFKYNRFIKYKSMCRNSYVQIHTYKIISHVAEWLSGA